MKKPTSRRVSLVSFIFIAFLFSLSFSFHSSAATKLSYNGKNVKYTKTLVNVAIDGKKINLHNTKGIILSNTSMVPYTDVFQSGMKASCSYSSSKKKLTIKKNGVTIVMYLGKKYAYVNKKKVKLPVAPLKVKYVSAKKAKILVPAYFVATKLQYKYSWDSITKSSCMTKPFAISYNNKTYYYNKYKANLNFNSTNYTLQSIPGLCIDGGTLLPAKEVFQNNMGMSYTYDGKTQNITVSNPNNGTIIVMTVNSKTAYVNGIKKTLSIAPRKITRLDNKKTYICIPGANTASYLGYLYKWNSNLSKSFIHDSSYLKWFSNDLSIDPSYFQNSISEISAVYSLSKSCTTFSFQGTNADTMSQATVESDGTNLTITIPNTSAKLNESFYQKFYEYISQVSVTQDVTNTKITISGKSELDYSYTTNGSNLELNIYGEYSGGWSLRIKKPAGLSFSKVTNTDFYENKKFKIYLPGNQLSFLNSNPVIISNNSIKSVTYELTSGGNTAISVSTNSLQGYKIFNKSSEIVVSVDSPRNIYKKIVVLDAGHGGHDPGAVGNNTKEKDLNFKMIYTNMKQYFSSNNPTVKAYWTRKSDTFITLGDRAAFAKKVGADMFVSLHMNSWTKSSVNGTEVYYSASNNKAAFSGITSKSMANAFLSKLVTTMGTTNRGVSAQKYTVVHKNTVPAVLIELGFISGNKDFAKISNSTYQSKATKAIYDTIVSLFNNYPTNR